MLGPARGGHAEAAAARPARGLIATAPEGEVAMNPLPGFTGLTVENLRAGPRTITVRPDDRGTASWE